MKSTKFFLLDKAPCVSVLHVMHWSLCSVPYPGAERGGGAEEGVTLRALQGVRWVPCYPHILSYKCHKDKLEVGEGCLLFCLGGAGMVNCPINSDSVNWWKG